MSFDPSDLPSFVGRIRGDSGLFSDLDGTGPAVDGARVGRWATSVGLFSCWPTDLARAPLLIVCGPGQINGNPCVYFDAARPDWMAFGSLGRVLEGGDAADAGNLPTFGGVGKVESLAP